MKPNTKKAITIISIIATIAITAVCLHIFVFNKKDDNNNSDTDTNNNTITLAYGSKGEQVKRLQQYLNSKLALQIWKNRPTYNGKEITSLIEDGIFGKQTEAATLWHFGTTTVNTNQF